MNLYSVKRKVEFKLRKYKYRRSMYVIHCMAPELIRLRLLGTLRNALASCLRREIMCYQVLVEGGRIVPVVYSCRQLPDLFGDPVIELDVVLLNQRTMKGTEDGF